MDKKIASLNFEFIIECVNFPRTARQLITFVKYQITAFCSVAFIYIKGEEVLQKHLNSPGVIFYLTGTFFIALGAARACLDFSAIKRAKTSGGTPPESPCTLRPGYFAVN